MFKNIFYNNKQSVIHLWEQINGRDLYTQIEWVPYVYVPFQNSNIKTIDGINVRKKEFNTYYNYYEWQKNSSATMYENKVRPEVQFLAERYYDIPDDELSVPSLKVYYLDIEVLAKKGFPKAAEAKDPITIISIYDNKLKKSISFGTKPLDKKIKDNIFFLCNSEEELLTKFFKYIHKYPCDVLSGWFIWNFDLPYIINRTNRLFGEKKKVYSLLSPINTVRTWKQKNSEEINIDIAGVSIIDYFNIYKWYSPNKLEYYTLEYVCQHELGTGKVKYEGSLNDLYTNDWQKYVDYNITDCKRVSDLEDRLGYIKLVQSLSLLSKAPAKYYNAMTQLIEGALLTHYRRNNMCAPYFAGGSQETFEAAHVKEPIVGMHSWVIDIDITSYYPSHIITLNMSNETYIGRITGLKESQIIYYVKEREFRPFTMFKEKTGVSEVKGIKLTNFNRALKKGLIAIAPCGSVFSTAKIGVIPEVERNVFFKRKEVKQKMRNLKNKASELKDCTEKDIMLEKSQELFAFQWALKIWLNAVFGILAVPYSRYFNTNIAEAITSCGRHTIKEGERFVNEYYHKKNIDGLPNDLICYIDTDSLFVRLGDYFELFDPAWEDKSQEEKINSIKEEAKRIEIVVNERIFKETQLIDYNSQVKDFKIEFKQEIIAKSALFIKKKKYAFWCVDEEGTPVDKMSVTGLEIVRSDSSEAVRPRLKHIMELILKRKPEDEITETIIKYKRELLKLTPEELAANIGINNLTKYIVDGKTTKGTPWHVRGVSNYRNLLKILKIEDNYEDIHEGLKAKVVYIKKNQFNYQTITFHKWPKEFNDVLQFDKETMVSKFFINKIKTLLEPMKKEYLISGDIKKTIDLFF